MRQGRHVRQQPKAAASPRFLAQSHTLSASNPANSVDLLLQRRRVVNELICPLSRSFLENRNRKCLGKAAASKAKNGFAIHKRKLGFQGVLYFGMSEAGIQHSLPFTLGRARSEGLRKRQGLSLSLTCRLARDAPPSNLEFAPITACGRQHTESEKKLFRALCVLLSEAGKTNGGNFQKNL